MTFTVSADEWFAAESYFQTYPQEVKFRLPEPASRSFVKFENGMILALARSKMDTEGVLGHGFFSVVKKGITKQGDIFAVKILGSKALFTPYFHFEGWRKIKALISYVWRELAPPKIKENSQKLYLLTEYFNWKPLTDYISEQADAASTPSVETLFIALECCLALYALQEKHIVHCDIKSSNILLLRGKRPQVRFIDFDFSRVLSDGQDSIEIENSMICSRYAAPEVLEKRQFSYASDNFSLGRVLGEMLLPEIAAQLTYDYPEHRITMEEAICQIINKIYKTGVTLEEGNIESLNCAVDLIKEYNLHIFANKKATYETLFQYWKTNSLEYVTERYYSMPNCKYGGYVNLPAPQQDQNQPVNKLSQVNFSPKKNTFLPSLNCRSIKLSESIEALRTDDISSNFRSTIMS